MSVIYKVTLVCIYSTPPWVCMYASITCDLVQALSGDVIVLIDPFSVTFEVDLCGW